MLTLIVRQTLANGTSKTWKIRPAQGLQTIGSSRLANLNSIDPLSKGIQGAFEYKDSKWFYINLDRAQLSEKSQIQTLLQSGTQIHLSASILDFELSLKEPEIFTKLSQISKKGSKSTNSKDYILYMVRYHGTVVETKVLPKGEKFSPQFQTKENLEVIANEVALEDVRHLMKLSREDIIDKQGQQSWLVVGAVAILALAMGLFGPRPTPVAQQPILSKTPKVIVLNDLKLKTPKAAAAAKTVPVAKSTPPPSPEIQPKNISGTDKVAGVLKSLSSGKLTQLLGKVSSQAAKSSNLVVNAQGTSAEDRNSGRALAAIGPVDKSAVDWSKNSQGKGVTISTQGKGGGSSSAGYGTLTGGKTGQGGVGLIEDESEVTGGLDREVIAQTIKGYLGQILYCYERQLSASPELEGKVAVKFTIAGDGKVNAPKINESSLRNSTVESCILGRVGQWKFPLPKGGTSVVVTYPFLFKSTN